MMSHHLRTTARRTTFRGIDIKRFSALAISLIYAGALYWVYAVELSTRWAYTGFGGAHSTVGLIEALLLSSLLSLLVSNTKCTRSLILSTIHYGFYIPSIIFLSFNDVSFSYYLALVILIFCLHFFSLFRYRLLSIPQLEFYQLLRVLLALNITVILLYIAFGGLSTFNLNLELVYEFRTLAADGLPSIFAYVYSNFSNVLLPALIVLGISLRYWLIVFMGLVFSLLVFGMTHHKSVLFTSLFVTILYFSFRRTKNPANIGLIFLVGVVFSVLEILYISEVLEQNFLAFYTSYFVRRTLMVPPMLDSTWVTFFNDFPKYYWSTSKFGLGIAQAPASVTAPYLIGREVFDSELMGANGGIIASGFSNAGLVGVFIYSALTGYLIGLFNSFGRYLGHALVAALTIPILIIVVTTTDFTTAILTHGVLFQVLLLHLFPRRQSTPK